MLFLSTRLTLNMFYPLKYIMISLLEIAYLLLTTIAIGYIFSRETSWRELKLSCLIAAPGVVLHELAHKFLAISFGLNADFKIFFFGILAGVILRLVNSPVILVAPGYVNIPQVANSLHYRLIAFAGPATNLLIWLICLAILKYKTKLTRKSALLFMLTKRINGVLFLFNMIPFGPLDGAKVLFG